jgi:hypothetical protein
MRRRGSRFWHYFLLLFVAFGREDHLFFCLLAEDWFLLVVTGGGAAVFGPIEKQKTTRKSGIEKQKTTRKSGVNDLHRVSPLDYADD